MDNGPAPPATVVEVTMTDGTIMVQTRDEFIKSNSNWHQLVAWLKRSAANENQIQALLSSAAIIAADDPDKTKTQILKELVWDILNHFQHNAPLPYLPGDQPQPAPQPAPQPVQQPAPQPAPQPLQSAPQTAPHASRFNAPRSPRRAASETINYAPRRRHSASASPEPAPSRFFVVLNKDDGVEDEDDDRPFTKDELITGRLNGRMLVTKAELREMFNLAGLEIPARDTQKPFLVETLVDAAGLNITLDMIKEVRGIISAKKMRNMRISVRRSVTPAPR